MATVTPPEIDPRDEETVVADVIDAFPAELSDRNSSAPQVKLVEGLGAMYGMLLYWLNQWPERVMAKLLELLDIQIQRATAATVTLTFTRSVASAVLTIPQGTVVKTGTSSAAVRFRTTAALILGVGELTGDVAASCTQTGAVGNVAAATLIYLNLPIATVTGVTNAAGATGGQDEEALADAIARAPLTIRASNRAITAEDFETLAVASGQGIERAKVYSTTNGGVVVNILAADLNKDASPAVQAAVQTYLEDRTVPGVYVEVHQRATRAVMVNVVTVELESGYVEADVSGDIEDALSGYLTAVDVYNASNVLQNAALEYGADLTENDLVPLVKAVEGVKRVVSITAQYSDDYGASWSVSGALGTILSPSGDWGLMHWGKAYPGHIGFNVVVV